MEDSHNGHTMRLANHEPVTTSGAVLARMRPRVRTA